MTELRSKKENEGQLKSKSMIENNLQSASVVPNLQLAAGHHKECLKFQCRLPKFVIDKMKHYMKL